MEEYLPSERVYSASVIQAADTSCTIGTQAKTVIASIIIIFSLIIVLRCTGRMSSLKN